MTAYHMVAVDVDGQEHGHLESEGTLESPGTEGLEADEDSPPACAA